MTAHGEPTTCSARRRTAEIAASAGVRSPPWGYRYLPCHGAAITLSLSLSLSLSLGTGPLFTLTTHCTLPTTHRPLLCLTSPLTSHVLDSLVSGPQGCNFRWRNKGLPGSPCGPRSLAREPIDRCLRCSRLSLCHFVSTVPVLHQVQTNQVPTASLITDYYPPARLATCDLRLVTCDVRLATCSHCPPGRPQRTHDTAAAPYSSIANLLLPAPPPCEHVQTLRLLLPLLRGHAPCSTHPSPVRPRSCPLLLLLLAESVPLSSPTH
jgi:hypothetical protein